MTEEPAASQNPISSYTRKSSDVTFYGSDSGINNSRYITALKDSFQVKNEFRNRMQGILDVHQQMAASASSYAELYLVGRKAEEATKRLGDETVAKSENERIDKDREQTEKEQEEKIQEKNTAKADKNSPTETITEAVNKVLEETGTATGETTGSLTASQETAQTESARSSLADHPLMQAATNVSAAASIEQYAQAQHVADNNAAAAGSAPSGIQLTV
ncbi:MAG: hypothetical protein ACNI3A_06305 [Desulfovibrio sp.]|uniref:hypothetical protein n=1 Tax=Desulfovibrio sp. 7SRBS1 TaxID=3378064 RepID=UPI003B422F4A